MLTAKQLVTYALQAVKAPGYTSQAGDFLNARLSTLARQFDFDVLKTFTTINVTAGTQQYNLPANYVRGLSLYYYIGGLPQTLDQIDLDTYNAVNTGSVAMSYPTQWASDPSTTPPTLYLYPMPNTSFPLTLRYVQQPADISNPATSSMVPWFPDSMTLLAMMVSDLAQLTDDTRSMEFARKAAAMFDAFLKMQGDREGYARRVKLGGSFSGTQQKLPASKITGF
jgi:hypothetical protein